VAFAFTTHPDVTLARTLPSAFYVDPAFHALTRERVFARTWQWLGDLDDVKLAGSLSPREMLAGHLDEPLLLARDGRRRAALPLERVHASRQHPGVSAVPRRADPLRLPLEAIRPRGTHDVHARLRAGERLPRTRGPPAPRSFRRIRGAWVASLAPAAPFESFIADVLARLAWLPFDALRHDPARDRDFEVGAHWALYVENYLEGLHIPFLHPALNQVIDMERYSYHLGRYGSLQLALAREGDQAFELPPDSVDHGQRVAAYYWWVFPNLMLNFYPWGLSLNLVQPLAPDRTRVSFRAYVRDADRLASGAGAGLDQVEMEDEAAVEAVQRGLRSRLYDRGRYSPSHERGVHHFHRLLCEFLAEPSSPT
jgi:choline monooxygenase